MKCSNCNGTGGWNVWSTDGNDTPIKIMDICMTCQGYGDSE